MMFICTAAGKSAYINGWKYIQWENVFFPLIKNHTKYSLASQGTEYTWILHQQLQET